MSIKMKMLLPMILIIIVAVAGILISTILLFSNYVDESMMGQVAVGSTVAQRELENVKKDALVSSRMVAADDALIAAIEGGDREAVVQRAVALQQDTGTEFCTITDPTGTVLARSHEPDNYGDDVSSQTNIASALQGQELSAIEQGSAVKLSARAGVPIYNSAGTLIGVASSGYRLDTETFVDGMKAMLNSEVTIFLGDERISTTVVKPDGTRAIGTKASADVSEKVLAGTEYTGQATILEHQAIAKYTPLHGPDGKIVGMVFVGHYLTEKSEVVMTFIMTGLIIIAVILVAAIALIIVLVRRIVTPIRAMADAANQLALGDLDVKIDVRTKDETRKLADAFNTMIMNMKQQSRTIEEIAQGDLTVSVESRSDKDIMNKALSSMLEMNNNTFSQIIGSAREVSTGAQQLANTAQNAAQGATEQAAAVQELSDSITNIADKTKQNAQLANRAAQLGHEVKESAEIGSAQMDQMVKAVDEINQASQSIGNVIQVIDNIAFQTNILALNAAVEAARAGQQGKGFAVVAEEVRSLASKSADAAKNTAELIADSMEKADLGARIARETSESLTKIVQGVEQSSAIAADIANYSDEQATELTQITEGINQISQVVQANSAASQQSAASSHEMSTQAALLNDLMGRFRLRDGVESAALEEAPGLPPLPEGTPDENNKYF